MRFLVAFFLVAVASASAISIRPLPMIIDGPSLKPLPAPVPDEAIIVPLPAPVPDESVIMPLPAPIPDDIIMPLPAPIPEIDEPIFLEPSPEMPVFGPPSMIEEVPAAPVVEAPQPAAKPLVQIIVNV